MIHTISMPNYVYAINRLNLKKRFHSYLFCYRLSKIWGGTVVFTYFRWLCCRRTSCCTGVLQHECYPAEKMTFYENCEMTFDWFLLRLYSSILLLLLIRVTLILILVPSHKANLWLWQSVFFRDDDPLSKLPLLQFHRHSTWFWF